MQLISVFIAVRWDLGALVAVGSVAVTGSGFILVVLASLLHGGEFAVYLRACISPIQGLWKHEA